MSRIPYIEKSVRSAITVVGFHLLLGRILPVCANIERVDFYEERGKLGLKYIELGVGNT